MASIKPALQVQNIAQLVHGNCHGDNVTVTGIELDSRAITEGDLYVALPGAQTHGANFAAAALNNGAAAVLTDPAGQALIEAAGLSHVPTITCQQPRENMAYIADELFGSPSKQLHMFAITGTNGKTTTAHLIEAALLRLGQATGIIGTAGSRMTRGEVITHFLTTRTTPESVHLQRMFAAMVTANIPNCVMEVSSHALCLHRVDAVQFDVAGFTNLTQDHLDFHATMDEYFEAKAELFTPARSRTAVICVDDAYGQRLAKRCTLPTHTFTTIAGVDADYQVSNVITDGEGEKFTVTARDGQQWQAQSPLLGAHNVANTTLAAIMLNTQGYEFADVFAALASPVVIPGRMELVLPNAQSALHGVRGVVDFAHSEDSLEKCLQTLRPYVGKGKLICVFGAAGDRDTTKRPHMGRVVAQLADVIIVSDDDPHSEDPQQIRDDIRQGIFPYAGEKPVFDIGDRKAAIEHAVSLAAPGDLVLLAGRGHETSQQYGDTYVEIDDRVALLEAFAMAPASHT